MLAWRTVGSKVPREAACALWLAQLPAEKKQGRLEGPPCEAHPGPPTSALTPCCPTCTQRLGEGLTPR